MTVQDVIGKRRAARHKPSDEDLRRLPDRKALIYGRVSSPGQVRDSQESIREIAHLVDLVKKDGYKTGLDSISAEEWFTRIQGGDIQPGVLESSDVILDCRDLGISGTLGQDKRLGLANAKTLLERRQLGAIYLSELSRLSRDQNKVEPYILLKLMKESNCKVRTPESILSPCIQRDWDILDEEFEDAREELKVWRRRLHSKKLRKAERGEYVGGPVCVGFYLPIETQDRSGRYRFGKMVPYEPHVCIVNRILQEFISLRSPFDTLRALKGVTFPFFPPDLAYMESRTALRPCPKTPDGYAITLDLIYGLAQNLALIGVWVYGDIVIEGNHDAIVPEALFWEAYEITNSAKHRGRAVYHEPLPFDGLLRCANHGELQHISANNGDKTYVCANEYRRGNQSRICLHVTHQVIDTPVMSEVLAQLDFTPYVEEVLAKLEAEATEGKLEDTRRKRHQAELETTLANLRANLGRTQNAELISEYESQILQVKEQLAGVNTKKPRRITVTKPDINSVREFLTNLKYRWDSYPAKLKNRLLKLLIEMVVLKHDSERIEATIIWKAGFEQRITIRRPLAKGGRDKRWTTDENKLLTIFWPSCSREAVQAALPNRSWKSICCHAHYLKMRRKRGHPQTSPQKRWSPEEEARAKAMYEAGVSLDDIVAEFGRNRTAILNRACQQGWHRPASAKWQKAKVTWVSDDLKVLQSAASGR